MKLKEQNKKQEDFVTFYNEDDAAKHATKLEADEKLLIESGHMVCIAGNKFLELLQKIDSEQYNLLSSWKKLKNGFVLKCIPVEEYNDLVNKIYNECAKKFDIIYGKLIGDAVPQELRWLVALMKGVYSVEHDLSIVGKKCTLVVI